jgi:hypothetical protein
MLKRGIQQLELPEVETDGHFKLDKSHPSHWHTAYRYRYCG